MPDNLRLTDLNAVECEEVRRWRNTMRETLRTPYFLTAEMQAKFYAAVVCNRESPHRYWAITDSDATGTLFAGMGGLTNIQWENGLAEISLILNPMTPPRQGYGAAAVKLLLDEGFGQMGLETIFGECYECNPGYGFWVEMVTRYHGHATTLPRRKRWNGRLYDALLFSFFRPNVEDT